MVIRQTKSCWPRLGLLLARFPISLHATWLTAASLLNLNGWAAVSEFSLGTQIALAQVSSYLAAFFGTDLLLYLSGLWYYEMRIKFIYQSVACLCLLHPT